MVLGNAGQEPPQYVLKQVKMRVLVPKSLMLLGLGFIFYVGILLNVVLLDLTGAEETKVKLGALALIGGLAGLGMVLSWKSADVKYLFMKDRIVFGNKMFYYGNIVNTQAVQGFWDRRFKTKKIVLGESFGLQYVPVGMDVENYLTQLRDYARRT